MQTKKPKVTSSLFFSPRHVLTKHEPATPQSKASHCAALLCSVLSLLVSLQSPHQLHNGNVFIRAEFICVEAKFEDIPEYTKHTGACFEEDTGSASCHQHAHRSTSSNAVSLIIKSLFVMDHISAFLFFFSLSLFFC